MMKQIKQANWLLLLWVLAFLPNALLAQDILVKVKQGTAKIGSLELNTNSASVALKSSDVLAVAPKAMVIARQDVIIVELSENKSYSHADISAAIKKKKQASSGGFTAVAFKDPIQKTNPTPIKGSSTRASGIVGTPNFYYPYTNTLVCDADPIFYIGNVDTRLESNIVLKNTETGTVYYDAKPEGEALEFSVANLPAGTYEWAYSISYFDDKSDKKTESFNNTFKVPAAEDKKTLLQDVDAVKKELKGFSAEMQEVLLLEYCVEKGVYRKLK